MEKIEGELAENERMIHWNAQSLCLIRFGFSEMTSAEHVWCLPRGLPGFLTGLWGGGFMFGTSGAT